MPERVHAASRDARSERRGHLTRWLLGIAALVLLGWAMHALTAVLVPVVFAMIIALMLAPVDRAIADRLPKQMSWFGRIGVMIVLLAVLALFILGLVYCAEQLIAKLPSPEQMRTLVESRMEQVGQGQQGSENGLRAMLVDALGRSSDALTNWLASASGSVLQQVAGATGTLLASVVLVVFLVVLMLAEGAVWEDKIERLWGARSGDIRSAIHATAVKLRRWILIRTAIGVLSAAAYVGWLALFVVDLLAVWALLTFLLVFIPNVGAVISGVLPTLYAFATRDFATAMWIGTGLFVIEKVIGNWIDPRIQGRQIAMSPVVLFVALLLWSWIWGIAGAFLATPITVAAMAICAHIPSARPFALLLSDQSDMETLDDKLAA